MLRFDFYNSKRGYRATTIARRIMNSIREKCEYMFDNTIIINGVTIATSASRVSVANGKVVVDGKDVTPDGKEINISIVGNIEQVRADACSTITVTGDAGAVESTSGDIEVGGNVRGSVASTAGDIDIGGNVGGNVESTAGNINIAGTVGGSVETLSGDIKYRK